jgi:hypothetical protein
MVRPELPKIAAETNWDGQWVAEITIWINVGRKILGK